MRKNRNFDSKVKKNTNDISTNGFIPTSFRLISSCIKTVSSNVRSAGASVAGSISGDSDEDHKDQVLFACFDKLELNESTIKHVLLLGYSNGFQVLDVEDSTNVTELISRRDDPVTFLQLQPTPERSDDCEGFRISHPLILVVASEDTRRDGLVRDCYSENSPNAVRFYSIKSHNYVHVLRFRSTVYMVRCSSRIVAVGLAGQIYCFDALTLESKFSILTYPVPQISQQGLIGVNIGYGPMAVGPRWLAYASNNPLVSNTGRLSPSPGVSPSTSPGNGTLMARYAMESSKQLASGLMNLGDMGYKTISKYCHDGSNSNSPVFSSSSPKKISRVAAHPVETDAAGMVLIKDFISREVVSQFRAHTSPISALCFDPSGTLLVTASIAGNNINIFRIMPSSSHNGTPGTRTYDWTSSHVHLYKLHRGMTSAVIQDICFSRYSQWIAIVSSRGTCHIFVLSPFGGETGLQVQTSPVNGSTLLPILSNPWWSTSSFTKTNSISPPPPPAATLSVVSRIKNGNGWLNAVSKAANGSPPAGAVGAVFHNSLSHSLSLKKMNNGALENLMVYWPSGNVIQYDLVPAVGGGEQGESMVEMQDEDLKVKVETIQWWDVCRRSDWPEREEPICGPTVLKEGCIENLHEQAHWNLSNAEVQIRSGQIPVWQKSKIYFYGMIPHGPVYEEMMNVGGEIEIEKLAVNEMEMRRKDLLPVFAHFHTMRSDWNGGRSNSGGRFSASSSYEGDKEKFSEDSRAKLLPPSTNGNSHGGTVTKPPHIFHTGLENEAAKIPNYMTSSSPISGTTIQSKNSTSCLTSDISNTSSNRSDSSMNIIDEGPSPIHDDIIMHSNKSTLGFDQYFQEEYCKADDNTNLGPTELMEDVSKEKSDDDADCDDMFGGVFDFAEEG